MWLWSSSVWKTIILEPEYNIESNNSSVEILKEAGNKLWKSQEWQTDS